MKLAGISYRLDGASWRLKFRQAALRLLLKHVQDGRSSKESVGQLYTKDLTSETIVVDHATLLKPDWAIWSRVRFDTRKADKERRDLLEKKGLHYVGLWHTHPESEPSPSSEDRRLAREHALAALPDRNGIVFVIVGISTNPDGIRVWIDDGSQLRAAKHNTDAGDTAG